MEPFPKKKLKEPMKIEVISIDIDLLCCCSIPDVKGSWTMDWLVISVISGTCRNVNASMLTKFQRPRCMSVKCAKFNKC